MLPFSGMASGTSFSSMRSWYPAVSGCEDERALRSGKRKSRIRFGGERRSRKNGRVVQVGSGNVAPGIADVSGRGDLRTGDEHGCAVDASGCGDEMPVIACDLEAFEIWPARFETLCVIEPDAQRGRFFRDLTKGRPGVFELLTIGQRTGSEREPITD